MDAVVDPPVFFRKIIRVKATDSPNVMYALEQERRGIKPDNDIIVPGVINWGEYTYRRKTWDKIRQCIGLDGEFYEGSEILLFPPDWLNLSEERFRRLPSKRIAKAGGCDPAEGGDKTAMAAIDEYGLIELCSRKTPNTNDVYTEAVAFIRRHNIPPERFCFDNAFGKSHADRMRAELGWQVRTVPFGGSLADDLVRGVVPLKVRKDRVEERYEYKNRRAQMYGELSEMMDPSLPGIRFALPAEEHELRRQLAPLPKKYDNEGRQILIPKQNHKDPDDPNTMINLIGCSPDEADALVLAVHAMRHKGVNRTAGPI